MQIGHIQITDGDVDGVGAGDGDSDGVGSGDPDGDDAAAQCKNSPMRHIHFHFWFVHVGVLITPLIVAALMIYLHYSTSSTANHR